MVRVYVESGDLRTHVQRLRFPQTTKEVVSVVRQAINNYPKDEMGLGDLMRISRKRFTHSDDDFWIATISTLRKAGYKVEKRKEG